MKDEKALWQYLKPKFKPHGMFTRIETGSVSLGIPDIDGYLTGYGPVKIELKHCKKLSDGFYFRPSQYCYFRDRIKAGDSNLWVIAYLNTHYVYKKGNYNTGNAQLFLIHGSEYTKLKESKSVEDWKDCASLAIEGSITEEDFNKVIGTMKEVSI